MCGDKNCIYVFNPKFTPFSFDCSSFRRTEALGKDFAVLSLRHEALSLTITRPCKGAVSYIYNERFL